MRYILAVGMIFLSLKGFSQINISLFYDTTFTETCHSFDCEAYNVRETLKELSYQVDTISSINADSIREKLDCNQIMVIPETEKGDLADNLDSLAKLEIRSYVNAGGALVIFGSEGVNVGSSTAADNLNAIFDFSIQDGGFIQSGLSTLNLSNALGTAFENGPVTIPNFITTNFIDDGLPASSVTIYEQNGAGSVVVIPYGQGKIVFLGWSWFAGGPGQAQDQSLWEGILQMAISEIDPREISLSCPPDTEVECAADFQPQNSHLISQHVPVGQSIGPDSGSVISIPIQTTPTFKNPRVGDVNVRLHLRHSDFSDIQIRLISPEGTAKTLWVNQCPGETVLNGFLDDEGLPFRCEAQITGAIKTPNASLSDFEGESPGGTWTLEITDLDDEDAGILQSVGLVIEEYPALSYPIISDACLLDSLWFDDIVNTDSCGLGTIDRTWTVEGLGYELSCVQVISVEPGSAPEIAYPSDISFSCDDIPASFEPDSLPFFAARPTNQNPDFCGILSFSYTDNMVDVCQSSGFLIERTWQIKDNCNTDFSDSHVQIIRIKDEELPALINCPSDTTYIVDGPECDIQFELGTPQAIDNCDPDPEMLPVIIRNDEGEAVNLPVGSGKFSVEYYARDACGNVGNCVQNVSVIDNVPPEAKAKTGLVKTLGFNGIVNLCWQEVDDGSSDNCTIENIRVSKDGINFSSCVTLHCQDVDQSPVEVTLKVWDKQGNTDERTTMITVQDTLEPILLCPQDVTVDCNEDYPYLSAGEATVSSTCQNYTLDYTDSDLGNCPTGIFERTWQLQYPTGAQNCVQKIQVKDINPPDLLKPQDITLSCDNPNVSPSFTGRLEVLDDCSSYEIISSDEMFEICLPGNYVIERTWRAENQCNSQDFYEYTQNIYVLDNVAPSFDNLPNDIVLPVDTFDCFAIIDIPVVTITDNCDPDPVLDIQITDTLGNEYQPGEAVIAGEYTVEFTATDACGNAAERSINVYVRDNVLPVTKCKFNLSVSIGFSGNVTVFANQLDNGSTDNCTSQNELKYYLEDQNGFPGFHEFLVFNCSDLGDHPVRLFTIDESGNSSYCEANIEVVDNLDNCSPPPSMVNIGGEIYTESDDRVEDVRVRITPGTMPSVTTNDFGRYTFSEVPTGQDYTLKPEKNEEWLNGVSTYDILLIRRHILNINRLDSPLKIIAADANHSDNMSTIDITMIRQLILRLADTLPNNTSWRFVPADYTFPEPDNPWAEDFPEQKTVSGLLQDNLSLDFFGIKIGDVNSSFNPGSNATGGTQRNVEPTYLEVPKRFAEHGEHVDIPVYWPNVNEFATLQFTLHFDPEVMTYISVEDGVVPVESSLGTLFASNGMLTFAWERMQEVPVDEPLFTLKMQTNRPVSDVQELMWLSSAKTGALAFYADGTYAFPVLQSGDVSTQVDEHEKPTLSIQPNPFASRTYLDMVLPTNSQVKVQVLDMSGQMVFERTEYVSAGRNTWAIDSGAFPASGVYSCVVYIDGKQQIFRIVALP